MKSVLTFILAGGKGERLYPLTKDRAKPAVPFGGIYRIIDFTLSNCIHSYLRKVYVLSQYKSLSLSRHIQLGWNILSNCMGEFITVVPAQQRIHDAWYRGTADAVYQNIYLLQKELPDLLLVLAGDHIYKMDYRKMIDFHLKKGADVTVGAVKMDKGLSRDFGVIAVDHENKMKGFQEKPEDPIALPHQPDKILASMGIYLFNTEDLVKVLIKNAKEVCGHDFGKNIIPGIIKKNKVFVYDFENGKGENDYWRDVGTIEAYYDANMDLVSSAPLLDIYEAGWPIHTYHDPLPPAKIVLDKNGKGDQTGFLFESLISEGCVISGGKVRRSILSPNVRIESNARVEDSILLEGVRVEEGVNISRTIVDKFSTIPSGMQIGYNPTEDAKRFTLSESGIVVVPRGFKAH